ncbi:hypothetical protein AVEN_85245-1 [Araneus ventricosus]|uniref:Uncharacterized protein n=1 Tax=Araneus ventricosus TaxID=182803 RepID=A0A4Y2RPE3_ARAVE|nr:hypothetical protein AVEN_85245-1 [Araneus ventricosus]
MPVSFIAEKKLDLGQMAWLPSLCEWAGLTASTCSRPIMNLRWNLRFCGVYWIAATWTSWFWFTDIKPDFICITFDFRFEDSIDLYSELLQCTF